MDNLQSNFTWDNLHFIAIEPYKKNYFYAVCGSDHYTSSKKSD
jgi:hypothetical protein